MKLAGPMQLYQRNQIPLVSRLIIALAECHSAPRFLYKPVLYRCADTGSEAIRTLPTEQPVERKRAGAAKHNRQRH